MTRLSSEIPFRRFGTGLTLQARVKLPPPLPPTPKLKRRKSLRERLGSHFRHHSGSASIGSLSSSTSPRILSPETPVLEDPFGPHSPDDTVFYSLPPAFSLRTYQHKALGLQTSNTNSSETSPPAKQKPMSPMVKRVAFKPTPIDLPVTIPEDEIVNAVHSPYCMTPRTPGAISLPPASLYGRGPRNLFRSLSRMSSQTSFSELASYNPYDTTALRHFIEINFPDSVLLEEHQVRNRRTYVYFEVNSMYLLMKVIFKALCRPLH